MHHQYSLQISVIEVEVVWQQPFCCHASRFMSRIQFIFITTMMKTLTIILFATSLMCIQQSPGFRLPLHMNYYYRQISTTTEELGLIPGNTVPGIPGNFPKIFIPGRSREHKTIPGNNGNEN